MDRLSSMGMEPHNRGVQTFDKNDWYQVMGHLEKCTFETNAAIVQIGIGLTKVIYDDYASILLFIINMMQNYFNFFS